MIKIALRQKHLHWGDSITKLWIIEYIKSILGEKCELYLDTASLEGHYSNYIDLKFADFLCEPKIGNIDYQILTHHRHWWAGYDHVQDFGSFLFFDLCGFTIKAIRENWYPKFTPNERLLDEYKKLNLPEKFVCIHLNEKTMEKNRNELYIEEFLSQNPYILDQELPIVSTGNNIKSVDINLNNLHAMLKLLVLINSDTLYCSHSGFTSSAAMYRKRIKSYVINYVFPMSCFAGPPIVSYTNSNFYSNNFDKLYYYADNVFNWNEYYPQYTHGFPEHRTIQNNNGWFNKHCLYEDLEVYNFDELILPDQYKENKISFQRENCLVPSDTKISIDNLIVNSIVPNDIKYIFF